MRITRRHLLYGLLAGCATLAFVWWVLPMFVTPSGVWTQKVRHGAPLRAPIAVVAHEQGSLHLEDGRTVKLAGVDWSDARFEDPMFKTVMDSLTQHGVEFVHEDAGSSHSLLLCKLPVWHWCGNDPVATHYEHASLNEVVLLLGMGRLGEAGTLTEDEAARLAGAARFAEETGTSRKLFRQGRSLLWNSECGINMSDWHSYQSYNDRTNRGITS